MRRRWPPAPATAARKDSSWVNYDTAWTFETVGIVLQECRLVGELITIATSVGGEMAFYQAAHRRDPCQRALGEASGAEMALHDPANPFPVGLCDALAGAAVGQDLDIVVGQQYIDEYAVAKFGIPDVQVREGLDGAFARREAGPDLRQFQGRFDHEADLAAGGPFRGRDGRLDVFQDGNGESPPRSGARREQVAERAHELHR